MPLTAAVTAMKARAAMNLRALLCLVAIALTPVSWDAAAQISVLDSAVAGAPASFPDDRKAISSTPSRDFIRSGASDRRALAARFADPFGDDLPAGLPAGFATVFPPIGIYAVQAATAATELHPARHVRPAATGPPDAAQALPA